MSEIIRNPAVEAAKKIAKASAARPKVDAQGSPTGPASTYTYDDAGRLLEATPGADPAE